jgi:antiviral helicase SKI2
LKSLSSGRVVVLRDGHFRWAIAVILKQTPAPEQVKHFLVLALVAREMIGGGNGTL